MLRGSNNLDIYWVLSRVQRGIANKMRLYLRQNYKPSIAEEICAPSCHQRHQVVNSFYLQTEGSILLCYTKDIDIVANMQFFPMRLHQDCSVFIINALVFGHCLRNTILNRAETAHPVTLNCKYIHHLHIRFNRNMEVWRKICVSCEGPPVKPTGFSRLLFLLGVCWYRHR